MGSSRLPGKTLMKLNDELSTLHFVKNQLTFSKFIDEIEKYKALYLVNQK